MRISDSGPAGLRRRLPDALQVLIDGAFKVEVRLLQGVDQLSGRLMPHRFDRACELLIGE